MSWIVFDHGNVLSLPQSDADVVAMARAAGVDPLDFRRAYWAHRPRFDLPGMSPRSFWEAVVGRPLDEIDVDRLVELDMAWLARPHRGSVAILQDLLDAGRDVALLSNAPACIADGLDRLPWIAAIPHRFYSGRTGLAKPDPAVFETVAGELDAEPGEIVFIDDAPNNVEAAQRVGMIGLHFTESDRLRDDLGRLGLL